MNLSPEAMDEWLYRKSERLGILCGAADPTPEQIEIAEREADAAVKELWPEIEKL